MQLKSKETQIQNLIQELKENELQVQEKQLEIQNEIDRRQKDKKKN